MHRTSEQQPGGAPNKSHGNGCCGGHEHGPASGHEHGCCGGHQHEHEHAHAHAEYGGRCADDPAGKD